MYQFANFGEALDFSCCTRFEFSVVVSGMAYTWSNEHLTFLPLGHGVKLDLRIQSV